MSKKLLSIQDLSSYGNSSGSLTVAFSSYFDVDTILIPTVLYSCHLGVDNNRISLDTKNFLKDSLENISFYPIIHIGYFEKISFEIIENFIDKNKNSFIILDPILSDNGDLFNTKDNIDILKYRNLIHKVNFITPNFYETCLLLNLDYKKASKIKIINGFKKININNYLVKGIIKDNYIYNILCSNGKIYTYKFKYIDDIYQGCGDFIDTAIACLLLNNYSLEEAIKLSLKLLNKSIINTDDETKKYSINYKCLVKDINKIILKNPHK